MRDFTVKEAAEACKGKFFGTEEDGKKELLGVERDSRVIGPGWMFVAIRGENRDGHDFIPDVFDKGAVCVISEKELSDPAGCYILVENSEKALQDIAKAYRLKRQQAGTVFVGVTGSVGKTSTKEMLYAVLSEGFAASKTEGNYNNNIGVPLTLCAVDDNIKTAITEMGINHYGEMDLLGDIVAPDMMVFTNIGESHIGNFGSREGIFKGKTEVLAHMKDDAPIIINGDDDQLIKLKDRYKDRVRCYSSEDEDADLFIKSVRENGVYGSDMIFCHKGEEIKAHLSIPGMHMVRNAAIASLAGLTLGMKTEDIIRGISKAQALPGRGRITKENGLMFIDETYNASPTSVKAAVDLLMTAKERKVAILGDMFELGDESKRLHYETGFYAGKKRPDVVVCIGELSADMAEGANYALKTTVPEEGRDNETKVYYFADKESFMKEAEDIIKKDDAVLLKASHGMQFNELLSGLTQIYKNDKF